jgi:hypothetical protein
VREPRNNYRNNANVQLVANGFIPQNRGVIFFVFFIFFIFFLFFFKCDLEFQGLVHDKQQQHGYGKIPFGFGHQQKYEIYVNRFCPNAKYVQLVVRFNDGEQ